jgi:hypothetical protein
VPLVNVVLDGTDHMCCGPRRQLGDVVTMHIHNYRGQVYEERHPGGVSIATQMIAGRIEGIRWRKAVTRRERNPEGLMSSTLLGYEPGIAIDSTDYEDPAATDWAFEFILETDDAIPAPRVES